MQSPIPLRAVLLVLAAVLAPAAVTAAATASVPAPSLDAKSYVLMDYQTGMVLAGRNADDRLDPASLTKIMTVYAAGHALAEGLIALDDLVTVSEKAWKAEGSRMFIEVGKQVSVDQLLDGIIIQSGNDASIALAEHISGTEGTFADVMMVHARKLGMKNSGFANATGLPDPGTFTTAHDMALLSAALIREFPELYARFAEHEFVFNGITQHNRNRLLYRDASVDGIKTGHTESAGYCLVTSAVRDGMRLIASVMGTASDTARTEASAALLNYGYRFFETRQLYAARATVTTPRVWRGGVDAVATGPAAAVFVTVPRGRYDDLKAVAKVSEPVLAPVASGQVLGRIEVSLDGETVVDVPLTALDAVAEGSFFSRSVDDLMLLFE